MIELNYTSVNRTSIVSISSLAGALMVAISSSQTRTHLTRLDIIQTKACY